MKKIISIIIDWFIAISISIIIICSTVVIYTSSQKIINLTETLKTPSYKYLKSVTVRLEHHYLDKITGRYMGWIGTGTIVKITDDFTYVLTNKHVAPMNKSILAIINDKEYDGKVIKNDPIYDLSLVSFRGKLPLKKAIKSITTIEIPDNVFSVGMYRGLNFIYTDGKMAGEVDVDGKFSLIMNLPCAGGCSGAGIFNTNGDLVSVIYAGFIENEFAFDNTKSICIPSDVIKTFLKTCGIL